MGTDYDVVVIGAGIAGASCAWQLARRGRRVLLLERNEAGHPHGSSHGPERMFRLGYADPDYVRLAVAALRGWRELEAECGAELLSTIGAIDFGDEAALRELAAACGANGVAATLLGPDEVAKRYPMFSIPGPVLFQADAARIRADRAISALIERAVARGARFSPLDPAIGLDTAGDGAVVRTAQRTIRAQSVVIAAGAWSSGVLDGLVTLPPVVTTREQVAYFPLRDGAEGSPGASNRSRQWPGFVSRADPVIYGLPGPEGLIKVGEHGTGPRVEPGEPHQGVEPATWQRLLTWAREHLPGLDHAGVQATTCLYASAPEERFAIDRVGPFIVCAALGGHGFKFGPELGRLAADLIERPGQVHNPFAFTAANAS